MDIRTIQTKDAPAPGGHYSQAVVCGDLVFVSGQLPIDPATGRKLTGPLEEQAEQVFKNLSAILVAAGSNLSHVLKTTIFVADIALWGRVNEIYSRFMGDHRPARSVVPTGELHYGFLIEVEAIARINGDS